MGKTILIIARHGNTFSKGDIITRLGKTDLPLVETGLKQGRLLGECLDNLKLKPDVIFTSKLKRTIQTAEQAQEAMRTSLELNPLDIFNEIDYGIDENQPEEKVIARIGKEALKAWDKDAIVPNGWKLNTEKAINNWKLFAADILKKHSGKIILVITSNGIARFAPHITGDFETFRSKNKIKIATGALCVFENKNSTLWNCKKWNLKPKEHLEA